MSNQIAREYNVVVAVGDDWSLPVTFTDDGAPVDISGEEFTAGIYDMAGTLLVTLSQTVGGTDSEVLTLSTFDITLPASTLYRWVLRASSFVDRGLIGGAFVVRPQSAATVAPVKGPPSIDIATFVQTVLDGGDAAATFAGLLGGDIDGGTA
jgi:hypothetical protein